MKYHDLSGDKAVINYPTLLQVVSIAVGLSKEKVERELSTIQHALMDFDPSSANFNSKYLVDSANKLHKSLETYHVLMALDESDQRDLLVLKNFTKNVIAEGA